MDIIVCVKHVPDTTEVEMKISEDGKSVKFEEAPYTINEWDEYAVEEAILKKEKYGGTVTVITIGSEDADATLRRCLAKGADRAIRITDEAISGSDAYAIAKILYNVIKDMKYDMILTGAQASDDGYGMVGVILAEMLGIPHAALVKKLDVEDEFAVVRRELEGGLEEVLKVKLPALFTIQTGINEPRYVSIMGIRRARSKEIKVLSLKDLGLSENEVGEEGSWLKIRKFYIPPPKKQAEIISGSPSEEAAKLVEILKSRGVI